MGTFDVGTLVAYRKDRYVGEGIRYGIVVTLEEFCGATGARIPSMEPTRTRDGGLIPPPVPIRRGNGTYMWADAFYIEPVNPRAEIQKIREALPRVEVARVGWASDYRSKEERSSHVNELRRELKELEKLVG